jgi:hypothetical protein
VLHPELALIPIFMVSDQVLTLVGARLHGGTTEALGAYELNPRYRDVVAQLRPMPVRLMLRCVLVAALLALMAATLLDGLCGAGRRPDRCLCADQRGAYRQHPDLAIAQQGRRFGHRARPSVWCGIPALRDLIPAAGRAGYLDAQPVQCGR